MYNLTEYNGNCSKASESLEPITDDGGIVIFIIMLIVTRLTLNKK